MKNNMAMLENNSDTIVCYTCMVPGIMHTGLVDLPPSSYVGLVAFLLASQCVKRGTMFSFHLLHNLGKTQKITLVLDST